MQSPPSAGAPTGVPATAAQTSPENPWPLRVLSEKLKIHIENSPYTWVEGQLLEANVRNGHAYLTLRDVDVDNSFSVTIWSSVMRQLETTPTVGSRVVARVKPSFYAKTGRLSLNATDLRPVGLGELLLRLERLRQALGAEGLFDPSRKRRLPVLPGCIGLITGRDSDAEKDVVRNATLRWPAVQFSVINTVRAVAAATTPVVSAIGHEADRPILDDVADLRASTPTDAAKRIVPDLNEEFAGLDAARQRLQRSIDTMLQREKLLVSSLRARPVLANPQVMVDSRAEDLQRWVQRSTALMGHRVQRAQDEVTHLRAQVRALSPQQTLDRGYSVTQRADGSVLRDAATANPQDLLRIRVAAGQLTATVQDIFPAAPAAN